MTHCLANGAFCRCSLANHPHPSFAIGAPCLAHCLPLACPHGPERIPTNTPGTVSSVVETPHKAGNDHVVTDVDEDCEDEAERESTKICLFLRKDWREGISAYVSRESSDNWISERLLPDWKRVVEPGKDPVTYQAPGGISLESKGRVKVIWRLSPQGKTFSCDFQVHTSRCFPPDVIIGKSWTQEYGASALFSPRQGISKDRNAQRRPASERYGNLPGKYTGLQSVSGNRVMKLTQRQVNNHVAEMSRW